MIRKFDFFHHYRKIFGLLNGLKLVLVKRMRRGSVKLKLRGYKNSIIIRANTSDFATFEQIFINKDYDIDIDFDPRFIIDGGAYVGYSTAYFGTKFPNARIIAVEPAKSNFNLLKRNTINYSNVSLYNAGLWWKKAYLYVKDEGLGEWGFFVKEAVNDAEGMIEGIPISDILNKSGFETIDILKLDIEGSEIEIFSSNFESWLGKVKMLIIELHDRLRPKCSEIFFNAIKKYDFSVGQSGENLVLINRNFIKR